MQNPTRALAFVTGALLLTPVIAAANTSLLEQEREGAAQREVETNKGHASSPTSSAQVRDERGTVRLADAGAEVKLIQIDLSAQPLSQALREFSRQTGVQIAVQSELAEGKSIERLSGKYQPAEALAKLLKGTGLSAYPVNGNTYGIRETGSTSLRGNDGDRDTGAIALAQNMGGDYTVAQATEMKRVTEGDGANKSSEVRDGGGEGREELEEVVVTAQKREERLQDVPISISVLDGDALDHGDAQGILDALSRVPGIFLQDTIGLRQIVVRGVSSGGVREAGSGAVGYYLDSVPFAFIRSALVPDAGSYDLDRVEVLRGPQGTLYGASALNGVVRVLTKDAQLSEFEFKGRVSSSSTRGGAEGYRADVAFNAPIVDDKLAIRMVAGYQTVGGWIDRPNRKNANEADLGRYRLKAKLRPTERLTVDALASFTRDNIDNPDYSADNKTNPSLVDEPTNTRYDIYGVKVAYDFPAVSLTSSTSYIDFSTDNYLDFAQVGVLNTVYSNRISTRLFAEEVLATSRRDGPWRWSLGGMYREAKENIWAFRRQYPAPYDADDLSQSFALFGEVTRTFLDGRFDLTGGLRYFQDDVSQEEISSNVIGVAPLGRLSGETFDQISPRAVLTWHPDRQWNIYASYGEGYRSGILASPLIIRAAPQIPSADPDNLKNYELGVKGTAWQGLISIDAAVYYMDWRNVQQTLGISVPGTPGFFFTVTNGESASGAGFDLGLTARPIGALELGLTFSWSGLEFDQDVISSGVPIIPAGARPNGTPEFTAGASMAYGFPIGTYRGHFSLSANHVSQQTSTSLIEGVATESSTDAYTFTKASFSVDAPSNWSASLSIDNIGNTQAVLVRGLIPQWSTQMRPRTVGLQLNYHFK